MNRLVWLDLETTGLDPARCAILEIGIIITDTELNEVCPRGRWLINPPAGVHWEETALRMHNGSGLLKEAQAFGTSHEAAHAAAAEFAEYHAAGADSPLCGSTIHFDRLFLSAVKSPILKVVHYRNFDASLFRTIAALKGLTPPPKRQTHRALEDLEDSIALAKWGLDRFDVTR